MWDSGLNYGLFCLAGLGRLWLKTIGLDMPVSIPAIVLMSDIVLATSSIVVWFTLFGSSESNSWFASCILLRSNLFWKFSLFLLHHLVEIGSYSISDSGVTYSFSYVTVRFDLSAH